MTPILAFGFLLLLLYMSQQNALNLSNTFQIISFIILFQIYLGTSTSITCRTPMQSTLPPSCTEYHLDRLSLQLLRIL